jgi:tRNA(Ile)-lysidine synthase
MKILLAVSGGMDSMYMLARSNELFPGSYIAVAHCNFCLREEESEEDEQFVRDWCTEHGITCYVKRFDTAAYAAKNGISIEMAARDLRYAWFAELLSAHRFGAVAVAHNSNDNAETLILNLLRGTGSRGLRGMGDRDIAGIGSGRVLRPLLGISREEISAWMQKHGVPHREDSTNAGTLYKRNKLRNEVFPVFAEINPSFLKTFAANMRHFAQVDDIAEEYFQNTAMSVYILGEEDAISISALLSLEHWEYVLFRILEPYDFDEGTIDALSNLLASDGATISGKTFEAPDWKAVTGADKILLLPRVVEKSGSELEIVKPGVYGFKGQSIEVKVYERPSDLKLQRPEGQLIADADKLTFPLRLRGWEDGDWMRPLGLGGKKKLSDLFVDLKWSLPEKEEAIVLEHPDRQKGHVGALICERIGDSLKVTTVTERIVEISLL